MVLRIFDKYMVNSVRLARPVIGAIRDAELFQPLTLILRTGHYIRCQW